MPEIAFVALGANLGDRAANLSAAVGALSMVAGVELLATTSVEETAPLGSVVQGPYLNQMVAVATTLEPQALLERLQRIERQLGRVRTQRWGARIIDLDIVRFGNRTMQSRTLILPHPGLPHRQFWLGEVDELAHLLGVAA